MRIASLNTECIGHIVVRRLESGTGAIYMDLSPVARSRPKDVIAVTPIVEPRNVNRITLLIQPVNAGRTSAAAQIIVLETGCIRRCDRKQTQHH